MTGCRPSSFPPICHHAVLVLPLVPCSRNQANRGGGTKTENVDDPQGGTFPLQSRAGCWVAGAAALGHSAGVTSHCTQPRLGGALRVGLPALLLWVILATNHAFGAVETGDSAVVIYNVRSADSRRVAKHYVEKRAVPAAQVLGLDLPMTEEISRAEFRMGLQQPLFDWLVAQGLFSLSSTKEETETTNETPRVVAARIRYAVLCFGVPLKIRAEPLLVEDVTSGLPAELRRNEASVDSELAWLPRLHQKPILAGLQSNAVYRATQAALLHPTNGILLVARLDGPSADIAYDLVDKALEAERDGLWGRAYVDLRGLREGTYKLGDDVLRGAALACAKAGYDVAVDLSPATLPPEYPLSQVAIYAGWYAGSACGPFAREHVEFMPGAFAYHLHSFSAATLRSTNAHWVGPLLARGATVTLGSVYEPYLAGTSDAGTLLRNWLLGGFSFGEAAWSAEYGLSWQTTVIGDPLYRPFRLSLETRLATLEQRADARVAWAYAIQADQQVSAGRPLAGAIYTLRKLPLTRTNAVLSEKLGDLLRLQRSNADALAAYQTALQAHPSPQQAVRLLLGSADLQSALGDDAGALASLKKLLAAAPAYGEGLPFRERLLALAIRTGDPDLTRDCQAAIRRLRGTTSTNREPPAVVPRPEPANAGP